MPTVAEKIVPKLPVSLHVEGTIKGPQAEDLLKIDPAGNFVKGRKVTVPARRHRSTIHADIFPLESA